MKSICEHMMWQVRGRATRPAGMCQCHSAVQHVTGCRRATATWSNKPRRSRLCCVIVMMSSGLRTSQTAVLTTKSFFRICTARSCVGCAYEMQCLQFFSNQSLSSFVSTSYEPDIYSETIVTLETLPDQFCECILKQNCCYVHRPFRSVHTLAACSYDQSQDFVFSFWTTQHQLFSDIAFAFSGPSAFNALRAYIRCDETKTKALYRNGKDFPSLRHLSITANLSFRYIEIRECNAPALFVQ